MLSRPPPGVCVYYSATVSGQGGPSSMCNAIERRFLALGCASKPEQLLTLFRCNSLARLLTTFSCALREYIYHHFLLSIPGAGIAQWLERRTRDWKVAGSNPCWNGGRIFFSRVDFLCWLLFRYPFHPRVTTVARKKSRSFCQKCRWQVTAKHAYTLRMWLLLNRASALVTTCP